MQFKKYPKGKLDFISVNVDMKKGDKSKQIFIEKLNNL